MWKGSVLVAALAVALLAVAGVAVATVSSSDGTALTSDDVATTLAAVADDSVDEEMSTTTTSTTAAAHDDDSSMSGTTPMSDDDDGDDDDAESMSGTTTTTTMADVDDDSDDYDHDSDDYDDDDDYVMVADGIYPIDASPYGSVTVEVRAGMLYLVSIDVDSVWMLHEREEKSDEIELEFYWGESELKIKVEVDDGQLKKLVEFDMKDDDSDDEYDDDDDYVMVADGFYPIDVTPYGSVTVEVRAGMLYLTSIDVDSVWMLHKRDEKSDEVELGFYWGESELKIKVEVDDGQLKKMVEFDMK